MCAQQCKCPGCGKWKAKKKFQRHETCSNCRSPAQQPEDLPADAPAAPASAPPSLFPSHAGNHAPLPTVQRAAIVVLDKQGLPHTDIAQQAGTSLPTVRHWLKHYEEKKDVADEPRSGRPRSTDEAMDTAIIGACYVEKNFCTPRGLKRKYGFEASPRTIDRRMREVNLFGRIARHRKRLTDEEKRARLSFAEGYKHMTAEDWMKVMFADEKKFKGEGFMGQVWVRRPKGEADNPAYQVQKFPHPVKLNVWGTFCGRGLGYCYIFNENMDGKLLKKILGSHLVESAELHFEQDPPELWRLLQDNDPKHKSVLVRTWLHNHGISMLDFPAYSPDLNPMENLWNDIARRVKARPASTMEELQDVIAEEWAATPPEFLRKLARSMPKRCQAVIDAKGDHTKY
jgi:transposase